jgi:molybdopterin synthase catalytic subunit
VRPPTTDDWIALTEEPLPLDAVLAWVVRPDCGAQVLFVGTVRDHAEGREGVTHLAYEAYAEQVQPRLAGVAREARARWPAVGRIVLLHRVGRLAVTESSVVVAVSAPHRAEAFAAARFCIDTLKATVPIWKRESWAGGEAWGTCSHEVEWLHGAAGDGGPSLARRPGSGPRPGGEQ